MASEYSERDVFCVTFVVAADSERDESTTPSTFRALFDAKACDGGVAQALRFMRSNDMLDVHLQMYRDKPYKQQEWKTLVKKLEHVFSISEEEEEEEDDEEDDFAEPEPKRAKVDAVGQDAFFDDIDLAIFHADRNLTVTRDGRQRKCAPLQRKDGVSHVYVFVYNADADADADAQE